MYYNHKSLLYVSYCQESFCTVLVVI